MIDLHTHILPEVDDGASSLDEAVAMCARAAADGCRAIVATPHLRAERFWNADRADLEARHRVLAEAVAARVGRIEVLLGGEIALHSESQAEIDLLPEGDLLTLAGSRYVLVELPWRAMGPDPVETVHEMVVRDLVPIVAHPERVAWLVQDRALQRALIEHGALFQLTAMSVTGELGTIASEAAAWLLDQGWAHFIASDTHDPSLRKPGLSAARQVVAERWGEALAQALVDDHPRAVIEDRPLTPTAATDARSSRLAGLARRILSRDG